MSLRLQEQSSTQDVRLEWRTAHSGRKVQNYLSSFFVIFPWSHCMENVTSCSAWQGVRRTPSTPGVYAAACVCFGDFSRQTCILPQADFHFRGPRLVQFGRFFGKLASRYDVACSVQVAVVWKFSQNFKSLIWINQTC